MANPIKIQGIVSNLIKHDDGIYTVSILPHKRVPRFKAGQFLHLTIDEYDPQGGFWPESRVFSIASSPSSENVEIVYSVKGRYTTRMQSELAIGKKVWLKFPYGDFSIDTSTELGQDIVLIAGGTGISPYLSYLRTIHANGSNSRRIRLLYGIRNTAHLLSPEELNKFSSEIKDFEMTLFIENEIKTSIPFSKQYQGMITLDKILEIGTSLNLPAYFLSGPPGMIQFFKTGLISNGIKPEQIKIDEWE